MPQPGDYFVVRTNGWAAFLIRAVTRSTVNHAGILLYGGRVIEGRPGGAGFIDAAAYPDAIWSTIPLTDVERTSVVAHALNHAGAPYSWVDCAAIGLAKVFGWHLPQAVRDRLSDKSQLMCSGLVDLSYEEAGIHLFNDGRIPGSVSPGDLYDLIDKGTP